MKKILTVLLILSIHSNSYSQQLLGKYRNAFGDLYNVKILLESGRSYTNTDLYIYLHSFEDINETGGLIISSNDYNAFMSGFKYAKEKYIEWREVAENNNIESYVKVVKMGKVVVSGFFDEYEKRKKDSNVSLTFIFQVIKINDEINYLYRIETSRLENNYNNIDTHRGFLLAFNSLEQIDEFSEIISKEGINNYKEIDVLFKD